MQNWIFTINFDATTEEDLTDEQLQLPTTWDNVLFGVWQLERGEETHRFHLQGYIRLKTRQRLSFLKRLHATAHWENRRGTHAQAKAYCTKLDTRVKGPWTIGEDLPEAQPKQGQRTDLNEVKRKLDDGVPIAQIAEEDFHVWVKYHKALQEYKRLKTPQRESKTEVLVIIGPTGVGKSHLARSILPHAYWVDNPRSTSASVWWDDYDGVSHVVIDEYYGWMPYSFMLRLLDQYPLKCEIKGSHVNFSPKSLIITSNKYPEDWYDIRKCPFEPLLRRLDYVITMDYTHRIIFLKDETTPYVHHLPPTSNFYDTQINLNDLYS